MISHRITRLDGLRGVAILLVLLRHFGFEFPTASIPDKTISTLLLFGWCGVDLFFVLSGFLITGILIETRNAEGYFRSFWARRVLRIVPAYFAFLTLWFLILPTLAELAGLHADFGQDRQLAYWTWTANLFGNVYQLGHLWSLSVEEQFYLLWPLIVFALPNRRLAIFCISLVIVCPAIRAVLLSFHPQPSWPLRVFARWDSLGLGAMLAVLQRDEIGRQLLQRYWKLALSLGAIGMIAVCAAIGSVDLQTIQNPLASIGISLIDISFAALLAGVLQPKNEALFSCLDWRWLRSFGLFSYAIYLFHGPIAHISMHALPSTRWWPMLQIPAVYIGFIATCISVSYLIGLASWHLIEKHFLRLKGHFSVRPQAMHHATSPVSSSLPQRYQ